MPKTLNFIVNMWVYPFDVMVSVGESDDQLFKTMKPYDLTEDDLTACKFADDYAKGRYAELSNNASLLRIRRIPKTPEDYGYLQHEIFHVVSVLFHRIGMKLEVLVSDEAYAYAVGYLTTEIYKKLK